MILPDVNVLVYAFRNDMPEHALCRAWLSGLTAEPFRFGISPLVLSAVIRITTDPRIFRIPTPLDEVLDFCDYLLRQPHREIVEPGDRHWEIFTRLCIARGIRGRRVSDAWFAALAIEWDCEWITFDRDFARFPGLKWQRPAAPPVSSA